MKAITTPCAAVQRLEAITKSRAAVQRLEASWLVQAALMSNRSARSWRNSSVRTAPRWGSVCPWALRPDRSATSSRTIPARRRWGETLGWCAFAPFASDRRTRCLID